MPLSQMRPAASATTPKMESLDNPCSRERVSKRRDSGSDADPTTRASPPPSVATQTRSLASMARP